MKHPLALAVLLGLVWLGCDSSNPVAPGNDDTLAPASQYTITLTASSGSLFAGTADPVVITVKVTVNGDASAADGQAISVSTSLGHFGMDATNTPITLLSRTVAGDGASFEFYPGDEPGTAELLARLADSAGSFSIRVVDPGDPPEAAFEFAPNGLQVLFSDASSGSPVEWRWNFGDPGSDNRSQKQAPKHTFTRDDVYLVTLTVKDAIGRTSTVQQFVEVASSLVAAFEWEAGAELLKVIFTDASEGNPDSYSWDFGDGTTSGERNPVHDYGQEGEFVVTLRVTKGKAASSVSQFVVVGDLLAADFEVVVTGRCGQFTDLSTGEPEKWTWDFGDGSVAIAGSEHSDPSPKHFFLGSATEFLVKLTVEREGVRSSVTKPVEVGAAGPC